MNPSIVLEQVSKSFQDKKVLKEISLSISSGEVFGLLGPSGAGKTTLIKILTGQLSYEGKAFIMGKSCDKGDEEFYAQLGIVLDNCGLYDRLSAYDNLKLFTKIHKLPSHSVDDILKRVGLLDKRIPVSKLSKGMRQRLILARALLHKPRILFLDEPTSGLDPSTAAQIHKLLLDLKKEDTTLFLTTHHMEEAHKLCDKIALLHEGSVIEYGSPDQICRKYNKENTISILLKSGELITLDNSPASALTIANYFTDQQIETIHSSEPTLERVFMKLTGKELNL